MHSVGGVESYFVMILHFLVFRIVFTITFPIPRNRPAES